jgi:hypothetical protein
MNVYTIIRDNKVKEFIYNLVAASGFPTDAGNFRQGDVTSSSYPTVFISPHGKIGVAGPLYGQANHYEEITLGQLIDIVNIKHKAVVELNDNYTAEVYHDNVVVGCQTIPWSKIEEIIKAHKRLAKV